ncbi:ATP-binding protein [Streptomyces sp. SID7958]|uniref:ATP-binding protein n=2 Tax=unclassified Streptomyces TaxID=2593676 RepID=A0A6G3QNT0_9ACTN|nr:ATP-binding protein [Streptomyces sp. SID14436]NEC77742.1 ATP-binding protein [Streptomyces sp. SID7958]
MLTGATASREEPRRSSTPPASDIVTLADNASGLPTATAQCTSSPQGAQLARRFAVRCMEAWGHPPVSDVSCAIALVVGELAANAVQHGRVPGRDFGLLLTLDEVAGLVRVEVADAASAKQPPTSAPPPPPEGESGRGLLLVEALAVRWGSAPRRPLGKTVWAEVRTEAPTLLQIASTSITWVINAIMV